jgi:N-acetylneuraminic acid mutarotase
MNTGRQEHSATLLRDGTVLVAGGARPGGTVTGGVEASAELYDPATGSWTATGSMLEERAIHTATLLLDGTVLVAGGSGLAGQSTSAELYQPTSGTWEAGGSMSPGRTGHSATLLNDGRVLIAGGRSDSGSFNASAELYVPGSGN